MRKKLLALLLAVVMVLGMVPAVALAVTEEPSQTDGVYQIGTAEELLWFAQTVNGGDGAISAVLTADIDMSAVTAWPGIGISSNKFAGSFDGQGHSVTFQNANWGLFGYVQGSSDDVVTIKNVKTLGSIKRSGIAHDANYAHFEDCINGATITSSDSYVAGIVGNSYGVRQGNGQYANDVKITRCGNEATISGYSNIGGILGYTWTNVRLDNCYNTGNISGRSNVGGLVGYMQSSFGGTCKVENSYNTGTVTGTSEVGGIIGNLYNGVSVTNCYNAGYATYAIAGYRYNNTAKITNCYFMGVKSAKVSPDYTQTMGIGETTTEIATRATAVSASKMASAEFAQLLGSAFKQSCPTPVLAWQTAVEHTGEVCENCALGSTEKEQYSVSFQQHDGYTLSGEKKATQGEAYSFTIAISDGYEKGTTFAVKVNGKVVTPASDGKYTVLNVDEPLSVTVLGVQVIPGSHAIQLPADGYGYRTTGAKTVERDEDYSFTLTFVDGFEAGSNFKVIAQQILSQDLLDQGYEPEKITLTGTNGTYTIPNVQKDYRILVSGVEVVSKGVTATVSFSITEGYNNFHIDPKNDNLMLDQTITVPYFDLSLYGLERYYYNPYCYVDEEGNLRGIQQVGTPESAYDNITIMHAFIAVTEIFYFGMDEDAVGKGASYSENPEAFEEAISWTQDAGSSFMDFWDHGTNLNYYLNYVYPLGAPGWGSTSDQITIKDGDVISIHMITGNASGSRFGFFVVNDTDKQFTKDDVIDSFEVDQGEKINLTLYWTATTGDYSTGYERIADKELYWIDEGNATNDSDIRTWNKTKFGVEPATVDPDEEDESEPVMYTNSNGIVTISTVGVEPGTYYIAAPGGWTAGGAVDNAGFKSAGGETGPAVFKLVVHPYEGGMLGDVNGDGQITGKDVAQVQKHILKITTINEADADVNGDGKVTGKDVALIQKYILKLIDTFPAAKTDD